MQRRKTILGTVFLAIFLFLTMALVVSSVVVYNDVRKDRFTDITNTASILQRYYDLTFHQRELSLLSLGLTLNNIESEEKGSKRLEFANNALNIYNDLLAIGFADTTGQLLTLTGTNLQDTLPNLAQMEETKRSFEQAKKSNSIVIGEVYYYFIVQDWIIPIRVPIRDEEGKLIAVNTSAIEYQKMVSNIKSFKFDPRYEVMLVNDQYNTTQLYYPLEADNYEKVLHRPADIFSDIQMSGDNIQFEAYNQFHGKRILAATLSLPELRHSIYVFVEDDIIWEDFLPIFRIILIIYALLSSGSLLFYRYSKRRQEEYEHRLELERDFSNFVIDRSPVLVVGIDNKGICQFANPASLELLNKNKNEIVGKRFWKEVMQIQENPDTNVFRQDLTVNNEEIAILWNSYDSLEEAKLKGKLWFGIDLTDLKEAQDLSRKQHANIKSLIESTNSIIGLFDKNKRLIEFNQSFSNYAKMTDNIDLFPGIDILEAMNRPESKVFEDFIGRCLKGERIAETLEYPTPDGVIHFLFNYNPIFDEEEIIGVSMYVEDITQIKKYQIELEDYNKKLEKLVSERTRDVQNKNDALKEANQELTMTILKLHDTQEQLVQNEKMASLGILSAGIGHEINNPLNFIKNGVSAIEVEIEDDNISISDPIKQYLSIINDGVDRASTIVKSLSLFSRTNSTFHNDCDVEKIIDNCLVITQNETKNRIEVSKKYQLEGQRIRGNEGKLHQVFMNLVSNAYQAIPNEGNIDITTEFQDERVIISVQDSGKGISKQHLKRLGDPFFTTKSPGEGTGLGLYITYAIIEEHGGRISVQSVEHKGTTFTITLPIG